MTVKRKIALLIAFTLLLAMLAACDPTAQPPAGDNGAGNGQSSDKGGQETDTGGDGEGSGEPVAFRFYTPLTDSFANFSEHGNDTYILELWNKRTNSKIEIIPQPWADYKTKVITMLGANDIPELLAPQGFGEPYPDIANNYGPKGMFAALDDHWDSLFNVKTYFDRYPEAYNLTAAPNGKIYVMPMFNENKVVRSGLEVRGDILDEIGYDYSQVDTLEEITDTLRTLKDANGGKPVFSMRGGWLGFINILAPWFGTAPLIGYNQDAGKYELSAVTEEYKIMLTTLAAWHAEGLAHPDYATMADQDLEQLYRGGDLMGIFDQMSWNLQENIPEARQDILPTPIVNGKRAQIPIQPQVNLIMPLAVSAKAKNVDHIFKAVDYLYSEQGQIESYIGEKGVMWEEDPDSPWGGTLNFKAWHYNADREDVPSYAELGLANGTFLRVTPILFGPTETNLTTGGRLLNFMNKYEEFDCLKEAAPLLNFTQEENEELAQLEGQARTIVDAYAMKVATNLESIDTWDAYVESLGSIDIDRLLEIYNTALARYNQ